MHLGHADQLAQCRAERGIRLAGLKRAQVKPGLLEHVSRQPTRAARPVVPDVLENVGHLQALAERHGELQQLLAMAVDFRRVVAEQLGEHLADDAGNVIAIAVEVGEVV